MTQTLYLFTMNAMKLADEVHFYQINIKSLNLDSVNKSFKIMYLNKGL
jgi:hypothetical protein